jgi:uncharacterized SAM-binding protein YcdF (DUF218 family)
MTTAASFLLPLVTGPLLRADAAAIFCGEDGRARAHMALELFKQQAAPLVLLLGGRHEPPAIEGAKALGSYLLGAGVAPERLMIEDKSRNTHEQAEALVAAATLGQWSRILLVASAYHLPRAWLTTLASLTRAELDARIHLLAIPAVPCEWFAAPPGGTRERVDLQLDEAEKIATYQALGHCASYAEGLAYLRRWEGGP